MRLLLATVCLIAAGPALLCAGEVDAVRALRHAGGQVSFSKDEKQRSVIRVSFLRRQQPLDLDDIKSLAQCPSLQSVRLNGPITKKAWRFLGDLPGVKDLACASPTPAAWLAELKHIESLFLIGFDLKQTHLKALAKAPSLRNVTFQSCTLDAQALAVLAEFPKLEKLSISDTRVGQQAPWRLETAAHLAKLSKLRHLRLQNCGAGADAIAKIGNIPGLQSLTLHDQLTPDQSHIEFHKLANLEKLAMSRPATDELFPRLAKLKNLRALDLGQSQVTGRGLKLLAGNEHLQELQLWDLPITDTTIEEIAGLKSLRKLNLHSQSSSGQLTDKSAASLAKLGELRHLSLSGHRKITDAAITQLAGLTKLEMLSLNDTGITDASMATIGNFENLQTLWLGKTGVGDAGLKHLAKLKQLRFLWLKDTKVTDAGLAELAPFMRLDYLNLVNLSVSDKGLVHLRPLTKLEALVLSGTTVTDDGMKHLKALQHLEILVLFDTAITDKALQELTGLQSLHSLAVPSKQISAGAITQFQQAVPGCRVNP
jgi:internalin A